MTTHSIGAPLTTKQRLAARQVALIEANKWATSHGRPPTETEKIAASFYIFLTGGLPVVTVTPPGPTGAGVVVEQPEG